MYAAYIVTQNDFKVTDCFAEFAWQSWIPSTRLHCFHQQVYSRTIYYASTVSSLSHWRGQNWRISSIVHILEERLGSYRMCNSEYSHPNTCRLKCLLVCHSPIWGHQSTLQYVKTLSSWSCCYVCTVCTLYTLLVLDSLMYVWYNFKIFGQYIIR